MLILRNISRYIAAIVFIFSGFVKGVDPLGTAYRLDDYFAAYGTEWAGALSLFLSVILCTVEFLIGIALLFNLRMRTTSWALLLIMIFFTILTLFDAVYEPVSDCGCFGDAIKLTNWETFYKNIVLMVFTLIVFMQRNKFRSAFSPKMQDSLALLFVIGFVWFSIYNYRHLPMIDFRPWKIGNQMGAEADLEMEVYLQYRNKETGEIQEYLSPNYPWNDTAWMAKWEFVNQRIVTYTDVIDHNFFAEDEYGFDHTEYILGHPDYIFAAVIYDFSKAGNHGLERIQSLEIDLSESNIPMVIITSSLPEEVMVYQEKYKLISDVFYADAITLKTMIRANPGLMLFKGGKVMGKWHHRDIPEGNRRVSWLEPLQAKQVD
jgi:uncharacterized membrane protein YphA (DoxX/SURF4 family)